MITTTFAVKQHGTSVPETTAKEEVPKVERTQKNGEDVLFINEKDGWIRIDLINHTYAVGAYEG